METGAKLEGRETTTGASPMELARTEEVRGAMEVSFVPLYSVRLCSCMRADGAYVESVGWDELLNTFKRCFLSAVLSLAAPDPFLLSRQSAGCTRRINYARTANMQRKKQAKMRIVENKLLSFIVSFKTGWYISVAPHLQIPYLYQYKQNYQWYHGNPIRCSAVRSRLAVLSG